MSVRIPNSTRGDAPPEPPARDDGRPYQYELIADDWRGYADTFGELAGLLIDGYGDLAEDGRPVARLRYAADVFAGLFERPKRSRAFIAALKEVQDALGDLNDIVVGAELAHEAAALPGRAETDAAFVAGRITGAQKARTLPLTDRAEAALEAFAQAKPFWT